MGDQHISRREVVRRAEMAQEALEGSRLNLEASRQAIHAIEKALEELKGQNRDLRERVAALENDNHDLRVLVQAHGRGLRDAEDVINSGRWRRLTWLLVGR